MNRCFRPFDLPKPKLLIQAKGRLKIGMGFQIYPLIPCASGKAQNRLHQPLPVSSSLPGIRQIQLLQLHALLNSAKLRKANAPGDLPLIVLQDKVGSLSRRDLIVLAEVIQLRIKICPGISR